MCLKVLFKKNNYNTYKKRVTVHMTSRIRNASHIEKFNTTSFNIIKRFQIRSIKFKEKNVSEYIKKHTKSLCYVTNPSSIKKYTEFGFHRNVYQETYSNPSRSIILRHWGKSIDLDRYEVCFLIDISVKPDFGIFLDRHFCETRIWYGS